MAIWQREVTLEQLNLHSKGTMVEHLGIRFIALNDDSIEAVMPVDNRTRSRSGCCTVGHR